MLSAQTSAIQAGINPISLLIAEDDDLQRLSLRLSLSGHEGISIVGEAWDGPSAVQSAIQAQPSVVLMDIGLPGFDGITATERIKKITNSRVLILSNHGDKEHVLSALRAGADGYCVKDASVDQILAAILAVVNNGTWLSDSIANNVISHLSSVDHDSRDHSILTDLELKILNMILEGANLDGIALDLGVHSNQVYAHSQTLVTKLSLSNPERKDDRHLRVSSEHKLSRTCPKCHASWPMTKRFCSYDGTPTKIDPLIGTIFADRYEILSVLGSGSGGTVYKARHRFMLKLVAIKVMHTNNARRLHALQRFRREAIASSFLTHRNIVSVLDFGVTDKGLAFMIMDYCQGETLAHMMDELGPMKPAEAMPIFMQLLDGLEHAHQHGILHRDLKPNNVMVCDFGKRDLLVRILDFGTAVITREIYGLEVDKPEPGFVYGSPLYMSPEQCQGLQLDVSSDIYSMGCLMFEVLTGLPPIDGATVSEALLHQIHQQPIHIGETERGKDVPPMLQGIIMRMLRKERRLRYGSAQEVKSYLQEVEL